MTKSEAEKIIHEFYENDEPDDEEKTFLYTEAMDYLITEEHDAKAMLSLGAYYYGKKDYDLALKYYEMAESYGLDEADECLGYVWYYGRTGKRDFEKAFHYFSKGAERGNLVSEYKLADMYKNGYYVEKDYEKYVKIIEGMYEKVMKLRNVFDPVPEIFTRLARIRVEEGKIEDAVNLYLYAKDFLAQRIKYSNFFGNLNIMKWLIDDLYELIEFDEDFFDFFDLYYLLKTPHKIIFEYEDDEEVLESVAEDGGVAVHFNDKWYHDRDEFFKNAEIKGARLTSIYDELYGFEVL